MPVTNYAELIASLRGANPEIQVGLLMQDDPDVLRSYIPDVEKLMGLSNVITDNKPMEYAVLVLGVEYFCDLILTSSIITKEFLFKRILRLVEYSINSNINALKKLLLMLSPNKDTEEIISLGLKRELITLLNSETFGNIIKESRDLAELLSLLSYDIEAKLFFLSKIGLPDLKRLLAAPESQVQLGVVLHPMKTTRDLIMTLAYLDLGDFTIAIKQLGYDWLSELLDRLPVEFADFLSQELIKKPFSISDDSLDLLCGILNIVDDDDVSNKETILYDLTDLLLTVFFSPGRSTFSPFFNNSTSIHNPFNSLTNTLKDSGIFTFLIGSPLMIASYAFERPGTSSDLMVKIS